MIYEGGGRGNGVRECGCCRGKGIGGEEGVKWDGWILDEYGLEKEWGRGRNGGFGERG